MRTSRRQHLSRGKGRWTQLRATSSMRTAPRFTGAKVRTPFPSQGHAQTAKRTGIKPEVLYPELHRPPSHIFHRAVPWCGGDSQARRLTAGGGHRLDWMYTRPSGRCGQQWPRSHVPASGSELQGWVSPGTSPCSAVSPHHRLSLNPPRPQCMYLPLPHVR